MISQNGAIPPIFVPPGYISQVFEENGFRRIVVLPNSPANIMENGQPPDVPNSILHNPSYPYPMFHHHTMAHVQFPMNGYHAHTHVHPPPFVPHQSISVSSLSTEHALFISSYYFCKLRLYSFTHVFFLDGLFFCNSMNCFVFCLSLLRALQSLSLCPLHLQMFVA